MISEIIFTPVSNIKEGKLIDPKLVFKKKMRDTEEIVAKHKDRETQYYTNLRSISIYDEYMIDLKTEYKILRMYTYSPVKQSLKN